MTVKTYMKRVADIQSDVMKRVKKLDYHSMLESVRVEYSRLKSIKLDYSMLESMIKNTADRVQELLGGGFALDPVYVGGRVADRRSYNYGARFDDYFAFVRGRGRGNGKDYGAEEGRLQKRRSKKARKKELQRLAEQRSKQKKNERLRGKKVDEMTASERKKSGNNRLSSGDAPKRNKQSEKMNGDHRKVGNWFSGF